MSWKSIVKRETFSREGANINFAKKTFNYRKVNWVKLHLECGHVKTVREYGAPEKRVKCKECNPDPPKPRLEF